MKFKRYRSRKLIRLCSREETHLAEVAVRFPFQGGMFRFRVGRLPGRAPGVFGEVELVCELTKKVVPVFGDRT